MPKLYFNLNKARCIRLKDFPGIRAEYYWTYQVYSTFDAKSVLSQGFSSGCEIDDGYKFSVGQIRELNDPKFVIDIPNLPEGEENSITFDLHMFESDFSSPEIKKFFTNDSAQKLMAIYEAEGNRQKDAANKLYDWLGEDDSIVYEFIRSVAQGNPVLKFIETTTKAIPLIKNVVSLIKEFDSDDYCNMSRIVIDYRNNNSSYEYRIINNVGIPTEWSKTYEPHEKDLMFTSDNNKNSVAAQVILQFIV